MFGSSSPTDKLISSFERFRSSTKKYLQTRYKAFKSLEDWSRKNNNIAVEDVAIRMEQLFSRLNDDFAVDKLNSISNASNMFKRFKQFEVDMKKFQKHKFALVQREQKYQKKIRQCPTNKNIRDYEIKYEKAKRQRELAELKLFELSTEIDSTKSILFKKIMLNLSETLQRQNEAERVLLIAMKDLLYQIPDISNEEVDDLSTIKYGNKATCAEICVEAKRQLATLSSLSRLEASLCVAASAPPVSDTNDDLDEKETQTRHKQQHMTILSSSTISSHRHHRVSSFQLPVSSPRKSPSSATCAPPTVTVAAANRKSTASIYPRLSLITENSTSDNQEGDEITVEIKNSSSVSAASLTHAAATMASTPPPPTYSDSESQYSTMRASAVGAVAAYGVTNESSFTVVSPSAPPSVLSFS